MTPVKERREPINPNYARFYEFDPVKSEFCLKCPAKCGTKNWSKVLIRVRGIPVHTNWAKAPNKSITTVYICESPSNREFSHGLPSVGKTGQAIYKDNSERKLSKGWLDELDDKVYRTNLARCQADSGLQKRIDSKKNDRVNDAAVYCIKHLLAKVSLIAERNDGLAILFKLAIGNGFPEWTTKVEKMINTTCVDAGIDFSAEVMSHPTAR
ncbi:MAG: hypothetical protein ACOYL3_10370 [Desulfuromonadaceae bacterium]